MIDLKQRGWTANGDGTWTYNGADWQYQDTNDRVVQVGGPKTIVDRQTGQANRYPGTRRTEAEALEIESNRESV